MTTGCNKDNKVDENIVQNDNKVDENIDQNDNKVDENIDQNDYKVGENITFGHYEQGNNTSNGKEPITWRILDINSSSQYLIISEKVLDNKPYNAESTDITWEESTLRSWLNGSFIDTAFSEEEKAKIIATNVPAHKNPKYDISPGNDTTDQVFLLSIVEVNKYYTNEEDRKADATRYVIKKGVVVNGSESGALTSNKRCKDVHCYASWWLRSPGAFTHQVADVGISGTIDLSGYAIDPAFGGNGVRPAMWVKVEKPKAEAQ